MIRKINLPILSFALLSFFFLGCASGNVWLTIKPNGSGTMQFIKKEFQGKGKANPGFLKGGRVEETHISISSMDVQFSSIHDLEMDGSSFLFYKKKDINHQCLLFTLDTSPDSPWFQHFNITNVSLDNFAKESSSRDDLARFNNLSDYVVWEIVLPGSIVSVKDFDPMPPDWWIDNHSNRKAILKIPARDILEGRRNFSTYEVCSSM